MRSMKALPILAVLCVLAILEACAGRKAVRHDHGTEATAQYRMAQAYFRGGRITEALATMEKAQALAPQNPEMWNFYGQISFLGGRYSQAEKAYQKALELDPYVTDVHNNLGALYDRLGRKAEAEEQYRTALADTAYATPEKVHFNLGILYSSQGRQEEAVKELRKAVEIDPRYYQAHFELAGRLEATGRLEEAAREYEVAAPDYRNSGDYHYRLGFTYLRLGDKVKAGEHLRRVLEVSPGSENAARADDLLKTVR